MKRGIEVIVVPCSRRNRHGRMAETMVTTTSITAVSVSMRIAQCDLEAARRRTR